MIPTLIVRLNLRTRLCSLSILWLEVMLGTSTSLDNRTRLQDDSDFIHLFAIGENK